MEKKLARIKAHIEENDLNLFSYAIITPEGTFEINTKKGNALNNSYSCAKSFAATAVGLLYDEGKIDPDERVLDVLKDEKPVYTHKNWEKVLVRHVLNHKIGIDRGYLDIDVEDIFTYGTDDFLSVVFREPVPHEPGTHPQYSDAAYYLVSRLVEARAGEKMDEYLMRKLLYPMRIQEAAFSRCPKNHPIGATGLYIRSSDMAKLGYLYASGGVYEGKRLLSEKWIKMDQECAFAFQKINEGVYGKGGMYGQMLLYSTNKHYAAAWHTFNGYKELTALTQEIME